MEDFAPVFGSSRSFEDDDDEDNLCDHVDASLDGFATSGEQDLTDGKRHRGHYDSDRRNRREIANSNERKRMQSINAGFQSLRSIVCPKMGEKLSKAAILKYAAEFINSLMRDKQQLIADKRHLEQVLTGVEPGRRCHSISSSSISSSRLSPTSFPSRKRWRDTESSSSDEGIGFASTDEVVVSSSSSSKAVISELQRQVCDLKQQLEMERNRRLNVEMDRERLEQLQRQATPQQTSNQTISSSSSISSSASDTSLSLDRVVIVPPTTTTTSLSSKDIRHSAMWQRNLETIVEAIRHIEGDSGLFTPPPVPTQPERHSEVAQMELTPKKENIHVAAPLTEIQVHPVWLHDLASQSFLSSPDAVGILHPFHRQSLTVPSS